MSARRSDSALVVIRLTIDISIERPLEPGLEGLKEDRGNCREDEGFRERDPVGVKGREPLRDIGQDEKDRNCCGQCRGVDDALAYYDADVHQSMTNNRVRRKRHHQEGKIRAECAVGGGLPDERHYEICGGSTNSAEHNADQEVSQLKTSQS